MPGHQPDELSYIIEDDPSSFTDFIKSLRDILAKRVNKDICYPRQQLDQKRPLLAKPRADDADQQVARMWIRIKLLHVVESRDTTSSITLVMRDDNVDVVGFINQHGAYELGYRRTMPPSGESNSVIILGWGNSYKSILGVRTEEEAMDKLASAKLGKTFATEAVDKLSRFTNVVGGDNPRLEVAGLMFIVSESARFNRVQDTIAGGWVNGKELHKELMTEYVWKYVEISRRLREWKQRNYGDPKPDSKQLDAIYLVLNEDYDLLSFAFPEMLKVSFPDMFKVVSMADVVVKLQPITEEGEWPQHMERVCGKITAVIRDKHRNSAYFRVGSMLFKKRTRGKTLCSNPMALGRSVVAVPSGWVLHIEVDLHIKIRTSNDGNKEKKYLNVITLHFHFDNDNESETMRRETYEGVQVEVKITRNDGLTNLPRQLSRPVQVEMDQSGYVTLVYTIGDEMSFTEFIMALRRIVADHPYREELLGGHDLLNLSSSREHPVLARRRPIQPARWLLIKLQVEEKCSKTSSTTLIMRDDDLYIHGFINQQGHWYELRDVNLSNANDATLKASSIIPSTSNHCKQLFWGVTYGSILDGSTLNRLAGERLGRDFASDAVRRLSSSPDPEATSPMSGRLALAGLILMVCESARMNPVHDIFVRGWKYGTTWTMGLMRRYVWKYKYMSRELLAWKNKRYDAREDHPIKELQAIYLVLNTKFTNPDGRHHQQPPSAGNPDSGAPPPGPGHSGGGGGGGGNGDRSGKKRKRDSKDRSPRRHHHPKKPDNASGGGRGRQHTTWKSEEATDAGSGHGRKSEHASAAGSSHSQSEESSDAGRPDGESSDSEETSDDDSSSSGGNSSGQHGDDDGEADNDTHQCLGHPRVELLSMSADLGVIGRNIIVFDGKRGQIIYTKEEQGEKGKKVDLVLNGPYKGISAYGCFAIVIDIPDDTAAGSSSGDAGGSIKWEWDCYDPEYAKDVDQGPVTRTIISNVADVTYAVMSNAREATVQQVKLRLKDGHTSHGEISVNALIDGFKNEYKSVLLRQRLSITDDSSWFSLKLARKVVAVPCGSALHIEVNLPIKTKDGEEQVKVPLSFDNKGIHSSERETYDSNQVQVEVEVTWYPEIRTIEEADEEKSITAPSSEQSSGTLEEYTMGDLLPFAYPEMLKRILPNTFNKKRYKATVEVRLEVQNNKPTVYGKISALIKDNTSVYFRVGSLLLARTEGLDELKWSNSDGKVPLERSVVVVPSGWVLCIEVDLHLKTGSNSDANNFKATLDFNNSTNPMTQYVNVGGDDKVHVTVTWSSKLHSEDIVKQLSPPVEVFGRASTGHPTIVYTIGDELSFSEFIMTLRRILADHQHHEDILDGHTLLNLSSTREHPVLARQRAEEPNRWIELKLQVVEGNEVLWTTLFVRDDNVYVHGFMDQQRVSYELLYSRRSRHLLPQEYSPKPLYWDLKYSTILGASGSDEVVRKLKDAGLGRDFAKKAVRVLSRYGMASSSSADGENDAKLALAGLIFMIAESARMNPIFKSFACEWNSNDNGLTEQVIRDCVWGYHGIKSGELRRWKSRQYAESVLLPHYPIKDLEAIYLVLNTHERHADEKEKTDKAREVDHGVQYNGRPRVELLTLAMRSNLLVVGMTIVAFDGRRGQIIYEEEQGQHNKEEQAGDQGGWVDLVLTGPDIGMSAYGCFAIEIETPALPAPIRWEWDCYKPEYAAQVNKSHVTQHIDDVAKVTYAVMSNAREATVLVKLRLNGGHRPSGVRGEITAFIDGFEARSVLFKHAQGMMGQCLSPTDDDDSWFLLQLARNVVAVPCGRLLHMQVVDLQIVTEDGKEVEVEVAPLSFDNGICFSTSKTDDDGNEVQVELTWYPAEADLISGQWDWDWMPEQITSKEDDEISTLTSEQTGPSEVTTTVSDEEYETEASCTIGDELSFLSFIMDVRRVAANHRGKREDILDHHPNSNLCKTREHPLLPELQRITVQPARWLHIKLQVVEDSKTSWTTTLVMRDDNLYVFGFINQQGDLYELGEPRSFMIRILQHDEHYNKPAELLHWGVSYKSILQARTFDETMHKLAAAHLGRDFAMRAVRRLSSSIHPDQEVDGAMSARLALAGLIFMVCGSARMNPVLDSILGGWGTGTGFTKELISDYLWKYGEMSWRLLEWKRRNYPEPVPYSELRAVCLVLNSGRLRPPITMPARGVVDVRGGRGHRSGATGIF